MNIDYKTSKRSIIKTTIPETSSIVDAKRDSYQIMIDTISTKMKKIIEGLRVLDPSKIAHYGSVLLNQRQELVDVYSLEKNKAIKLYRKYDLLYQQRDYYYSIVESYRENSSTKKILIDSELVEYQRMINIIEVFLDYLRDCKKNCDTISFFIKSDTFKKSLGIGIYKEI